MSAHVVVVEDEPKIAEVLRKYLRAEGWAATVLDTGARAVEAILQQRPDAVLLDVMLPGQDGVSILRALRKQSQVPVLMVTARVEEIDRLLGLEFGADDYICKPFSPREVVARIKAVLRRAAPDAARGGEAVQFDDARFEARVRGRALVLTPVEYRLLRTLATRPGRVYSRAQLAASAYSDHRVVSERTIDSHIKNLRRKLAEDGEDPIESVYGVGYRLDWTIRPA